MSGRKHPRSEAAPPPDPQQLFRLDLRSLVLVFGVALAARGLVIRQLQGTALFDFPQLDALEFHHWASAIAAGHLALPKNPTHGPLYPFFLGGLLALFKGSILAARWVQAVVGAASCALAGVISARFFGRSAGIWTGILLGLYGPLVLVDIQLWEEGLFLFVLLGSLSICTSKAPALAAAAGAGGLLGLAACGRPTALALLPVFLFVILKGGGGKRRWPEAGVLALTCGLVVAPAIVAASRTSGDFVLVRGYGGINLWIGNDPAGGGTQNARMGGAWDRLESAALRAGLSTPREEERWYVTQTIDRIRAHPAAFVGVLLSKLVWMLESEEVRDNHSFYFFSERSFLLRLLPGFGLLLGLAGCGVWLRRHDLPPLLVGYLLAMGATAVLILYGMRYRLPVAPVVAMFAGLGASGLQTAIARRRWREFLALGLLALAGLALSAVRRHPPSHDFAEEWAMSASSLEGQGRLEDAEAACRQAIAANPASALGWEAVGRIRFLQGRFEEARENLEKAIALDPDYKRSHYHLSLVWERLGRPADAERELRATLALSPRYLFALDELGRLLLARGEAQEAEGVLQRALAVSERDPAALFGLARIAGAQGDPGRGVTLARRALAVVPDDPQGWLLLGFLARNGGDRITAAEALRRADSLPAADAAQVQLLRGLLNRAPAARDPSPP